MPTFKDILKQDICNVFLNPDEFAEIRTVRYDGMEYPDIPDRQLCRYMDGLLIRILD